MKVAGVYRFEASLQTVWNALFDAQILARTLPGCDKLEKEGDQFRGVIRVKMGPVQGKFQGKVDISEVHNLDNYRMTIDGRGPAGFAKAKVLISLKSAEEDSAASATDMTYEADIQVGGRIASVGQRLLDASIKAITKQSLESLHSQIKTLQEQVTETLQQDKSEDTQKNQSNEAGQSKTDPDTLVAESRDDTAIGNSAAVNSREKQSADKSRELSPVAAEGPSQAAFAMGVAREITKDLFPVKKVILIAAVLILAWAVYQVLT